MLTFLRIRAQRFVEGLRPRLDIYTDGGLKHARGSWAYVVVTKGQVIAEVSGTCKARSSLEMEILAAEKALEGASSRSRLHLYTDCLIVVDAMTSDDKLHERFSKLKRLSETRRVTWRWIQGHANHVFNQRCDELCRMARTRS